MRTQKNNLSFFAFVICITLTASKIFGVHKISGLSSNTTLLVFDNGKQMTIEEKLKKYQGTFQIQVKSMRQKPNIPYNIDELIEKNRKQSETVYISLGSEVRLKILSLDEIKSNSFKKLDLFSIFQN